jgi:hypothetical protein
MHLEMTNKNCPLCKRMVETSGHLDSTRLCGECRSLIHTIMPGTSPGSFITVEQAQASRQPQYATAGSLQPTLAEPVSFDGDLPDTRINSRPPQFAMASFDPVTDFEEVQADRLSGIETEYFDDFETSDNEALLQAEALIDPFDEALAQPVDGDRVSQMDKPPASLDNGDMAFDTQPSFDTQSSFDARVTASPREIETSAQADMATETSLKAEILKTADAHRDLVTGGIDTVPEQEAADPWDDPLPAWEYSRNEYPLYVGVSQRNNIFRLQTLLVPAVLIVCLVAAYLIFQARNGVPQDGQAALNSEQGKADDASPVTTPQAPVEGDDARAAGRASSESASAAQASAEPASAEPTSAEQPAITGTQWRHALQALASPSQGEANIFAERLVSAGIPAYVIPADIERRGKWFRVRVGGFNTAQEAMKFVAEARMRAKAAGISLKDLNVVDYEKP